jgi:hypothetical protein
MSQHCLDCGDDVKLAGPGSKQDVEPNAVPGKALYERKGTGYSPVGVICFKCLSEAIKENLTSRGTLRKKRVKTNAPAEAAA